MTWALDGTAQINQGSGGSHQLTLSTANANDIICVELTNYTTAATAISDTAGLTWQRARGYPYAPTGSLNHDLWWALAPSPLSSDTITITISSAIVATAFAISGANTTTPFDTNAALPAKVHVSSASPSVSVSTSNTDDLLLAFLVTSSARTFTPPTGFTRIVADSGGGLVSCAYETVSSAQSSATVAYGISSSVACSMIVDAIQAASGGGTNYPQALSASFTANGALSPKQIGKKLSASFATHFSTIRKVSKHVTASFTATAALARRIGKHLAASFTANFSGSQASGGNHLLTLTASFTANAALKPNQIAKRLLATFTTNAAYSYSAIVHWAKETLGAGSWALQSAASGGWTKVTNAAANWTKTLG